MIYCFEKYIKGENYMENKNFIEMNKDALFDIEGRVLLGVAWLSWGLIAKVFFGGLILGAIGALCYILFI